MIFVKKKFSEHYAQTELNVSDLTHREFGFGFKEKIDLRHKSFSSSKELNYFLVNETPLYISYSLAHYRLPEAKPMPRKEFLNCDLVFDLDYAPLEFGLFSEEYVYCVKDSALKIVEEYLPELGFSQNEIETNFSGQKGFHIHLETDAVKELTSNARKELAEFVSVPEKEFFLNEAKIFGAREKKLFGPTSKDKGWKKKFFDYCINRLNQASNEELVKLSRNKSILEQKELLLENLSSGNWSAVKKTTFLWDAFYNEFAKQSNVKLDIPVSTDLHRLIRLPDSLHGSTGFKAARLKLKDFSMNKIIAFSNKACKIEATVDSSFKLIEDYSFKAGETREVPEFVAVFMECKKIATVKSF
ncbi:hypothetical protein HUU53_02345 [Candidatus Micrarchaeota archaeon]|nr:hypothetical protein [Candidatus Micrarchaeota archaeon]